MSASNLIHRWTLAVLTCIVLLLTGCLRDYAREQQLGDTAYLNFPQLRGTAQVHLTGPLEYTFDVRGGSKRRYEIAAGAYHLTVHREGELIHDGQIFVAAGQLRPVEVR